MLDEEPGVIVSGQRQFVRPDSHLDGQHVLEHDLTAGIADRCSRLLEETPGAQVPRGQIRDLRRTGFLVIKRDRGGDGRRLDRHRHHPVGGGKLHIVLASDNNSYWAKQQGFRHIYLSVV